MVQIKTHAIDEADVLASNPSWGFDPGDSFTFNPSTMPFYDITITDNGSDQTTLSGDTAPGTNSDGGPNADNEGTDGETATITDQSGTPYGPQGQRIAVDKSGVLSGSDGSTISIYEIETYNDIGLYVFSAPLVPGVTYTVVSNVHDDPMPYGGIVCFVAGTLIATPRGPVPVEALLPGDDVLVADGRAEPLVCTGSRRVRHRDLVENPALAPIHIPANALGNHAGLMVSPQHRVFVKGPDARALAGRSEGLVSAKLLAEEVGEPFRRTRPKADVHYHHVMCARHELILANGLAAKTFYPGKTAIAMCSFSAPLDLFRRFPYLASATTNAEIARRYGPTAHPCITRRAIRDTRNQRDVDLRKFA